MRMSKELTAKQQRFVEEYLVDLNGTAACVRAGYSEKSAKEMAHENLTKPHIRTAIDEKRRKLSEKAEISVVWVMQELRRVYERCMQCIPAQDKNGEAILVHVPKDLIAEYGDTVTVMAPFHPSAANKALELLGRHLGAFTDKVEFTGKVAIGPAEISEKETARLAAYLLLEADDKKTQEKLR